MNTREPHPLIVHGRYAAAAAVLALVVTLGSRVAADDPAGSGSGSGAGSGSAATADAGEAEALAALARWSATLRDLATLRVEFRQTKTLPVLKRPRVSDGLALVREGSVKLSMSRDGALELELAADAKTLRLHYPALRRLEVMPRDATAPGAGGPLPLASGDVDALATQHVVSVLGRDGAALRVSLVPREPSRATYRALELVLLDGRLLQLVQRGTKGEVAVLDILAWEAGVAIDAQALELVVPDGTERIDVGAGR